MIGKTYNITTDVSRFVDEKNQLQCKTMELKEKVENLKSELEDVKSLFNTVVSLDDLNILVQDIKSSFEMFVTNTPRSTENEVYEARIKALEEKLNKIEIIQIEHNQPITVKKEIPKLNLEKKAKKN